MKCPYRIATIHQPHIKSIDPFALDTPAQDMETFGECYGEECPFWDVDIDGKMWCKRAWAEVWGND